MTNKYGVKFTAKDIQALNELTMKVDKARAEAYERAVKLYTQSEGDKASLLSQKISIAERQNLVIAQPRKVDIDIEDIRTKREFEALMRVSELEYKYGAKEQARTYAENFLNALEKTYGSEVVDKVAQAIMDNPQALLDAVNARAVKSIGFTYKSAKEDGEATANQIIKEVKTKR